MKPLILTSLLLVCSFAAGNLKGKNSTIVGEADSSTAGTTQATAQAAVPRLIKFNGALRDLSGKPVAGPVDITFSLYSDEAGGNALWYETQTVQADALGHYTVLLGAMTPAGLPVELFTSGEAHWLGVQVSNLPEQPRVLLVSVPYALKAGDAETLGGKPASAFVQTSGESSSGQTNSSTGSSLTNLIVAGKQEATNASTPLHSLVTSGATNFVDTTTNQVLGVTQNGTGYGILASASGNTAIQGTTTKVGTTIVSGVYGVATASSGPARGVTGLTNSTTGTAVFGYATAATGTTYGIAGQANSTSGTGLRGDAVATTGSTMGLMGVSFSTSGTGIVGQENASSGNTTGMLAKIFSPAGTGLVINNIAGGKLFSGQNNGAEKISIDANGNVTTSGTFTGDGSGLTNVAGANVTGTVASATSASTATTASGLSCAGCVGNTQLGVNYAASSTQGGDAANALLLNGLASSAFQPAGDYATLGANTFTDTQTVSSGNLALPATTSLNSGMIELGGAPFIHAYGSNTNCRHAGRESQQHQHRSREHRKWVPGALLQHHGRFEYCQR
jgi:hypothetical protein